MVILKTLKALFGVVSRNTYGANLERYITSRSPQNVGDIDRLTFEYELSANKRFL